MVPKIQQELAQRRVRQTKEALEKMQEIAKSVGITPEELLGS
nr:H-NS family nucleoid-associated regulatory protein [Thiocapsa sp.]